MLKSGDTISMTQSAVVLENLIGQFLYNKAADSGASKPGAGAFRALGARAPVFPGRRERHGRDAARARPVNKEKEMQAMRVRSAAIVIGVALLAGCATVTTPTKGDPFESYNRTMFTINDKVDQFALKPVAKGLRVGHAAAGARQRDELLLEHRRHLHRGEQSGCS